VHPAAVSARTVTRERSAQTPNSQFPTPNFNSQLPTPNSKVQCATPDDGFRGHWELIVVWTNPMRMTRARRKLTACRPE
jgi:hypothetical protein